MAYPTVLYGVPENLIYQLDTSVTPTPADMRAGKYPLGTQIVQQDGRKFRYAEAGGVALVVGNVITSAAIISTDINMTPAAGSVGDRLVTFTHGAATVVANYFAEGFVVMSVTPGGGDTYKLRGHLALQSAVAGDVVNLAAGQALRRAITTTTRVDLMANSYSKVIQSAGTTLTGAPVGVAISAIAATTGYGWLQTSGLCGVLTSGTNVVGLTVGVPLATAGAAGPIATDTSYPLGQVQSLAASGAWSSIILRLDA